VPNAETATLPRASTTHVEITLKYDGFDVDDGTMPIEDVISALRGFANTYGTIASITDPERQHQIRVSAISRSSFAVSIIAWVADNHTLVAVATPVATLIITTILKLIELKKATKGQPPAGIAVNGDNNTVIVTTAGDNTQIVVPREVYDLYKSKSVDGELSKLAAPLREGKVDAVSITAKDAHLVLKPVVITSSEKVFFQAGDTAKTATSQPVVLDGQFVSLNKESNRGSFRMQNGNRVRYHFTGENPTQMHGDFAHKGPVRVECSATFDSSLELKSIDITRVERLQGDLFNPPRPK
jgi:hypothetical protein